MATFPPVIVTLSDEFRELLETTKQEIQAAHASLSEQRIRQIIHEEINNLFWVPDEETTRTQPLTEQPQPGEKE